MGGNKGSKWAKVKNTFIIFLVSGFWHGANWTFIFWGFLNALYILPSILLNSNRNHLNIVAEQRDLPNPKEFLNMSITFLFTVFAWILFRSENMKDAIQYYSGIFSWSLFSFPTFRPTELFVLLFIFIVIEWLGRRENHPLAELNLKINRAKRWLLYSVLSFCIFVFHGKDQEFIYFQF